MIIPKIVKVMVRLDESQKSIHKKLDAIHLNQQTLLRALGSARRHVANEKPVDCSSEELRVAMHDKDQVALESAQIESQLSNAIYGALRPNSTLTKEQMVQLKYILENYKDLNLIAISSKEQNTKIEKAMQVLKSKISQVDKLHIEARAVMANHVKPKSKIYRPGVI